MPAVNGQPLCLRPCFALGVGGREESSIIFGMASGDLLELSRTLEFLEGVEARRVEETIPRDLTTGIGGDQRFADKVRDLVDDL